MATISITSIVAARNVEMRTLTFMSLQPSGRSAGTTMTGTRLPCMSALEFAAYYLAS
jgi:hypothetical protein